MDETTTLLGPGPYHVPQESRRNKLRFTPQTTSSLDFPPFSLHNTLAAAAAAAAPPSSGGLNLSLSTHVRPSSAASPVGPFTGYASILARSRFLGPAQELLDGIFPGIGNGNGSVVVGKESEALKVIEDSGSWFCDGGDVVDGDGDGDVSRRCHNPTLVSMLHEVYKRYKLYCQQMHSAVTSFESVAGLGNAAPFICFAIKAIFRHFHCLKNVILDEIHIASKVLGSLDIRNGCARGSCSDDKGRYEQKQHIHDPNFIQSPVWRSQRGFPYKAVAVLRNWLFEHFLHPYPSDSDKQMLAQTTGLSRSQVSNWFTNARVRLWKPMVEEMHALEKQTRCSKTTDTPNFINVSTNHHISVHPQLSQTDFQIYSSRDQENHCKRSRIEVFPRVEQRKEQLGIPWNLLPSNQVINIGGSQTEGHASNQEAATGVSWSSPGQMVPFWLAKQ